MISFPSQKFDIHGVQLVIEMQVWRVFGSKPRGERIVPEVCQVRNGETDRDCVGRMRCVRLSRLGRRVDGGCWHVLPRSAPSTWRSIVVAVDEQTAAAYTDNRCTTSYSSNFC